MIASRIYPHLTRVFPLAISNRNFYCSEFIGNRFFYLFGIFSLVHAPFFVPDFMSPIFFFFFLENPYISFSSPVSPIFAYQSAILYDNFCSLFGTEKRKKKKSRPCFPPDWMLHWVPLFRDNSEWILYSVYFGFFFSGSPFPLWKCCEWDCCGVLCGCVIFMWHTFAVMRPTHSVAVTCLAL